MSSEQKTIDPVGTLTKNVHGTTTCRKRTYAIAPGDQLYNNIEKTIGLVIHGVSIENNCVIISTREERRVLIDPSGQCFLQLTCHEFSPTDLS